MFPASDAHRQMIGVRLPRRQQRPGRSSSSRRHRDQNGYPKSSDASSPSKYMQLYSLQSPMFSCLIE